MFCPLLKKSNPLCTYFCAFITSAALFYATLVGINFPLVKKVVLISDSDFWYTMSIFILPFLKNGYKVKSKVLVSPFTHSHLSMLTHHKNINTDVELKKKKNQV
jgi:hypothetical protein